MAPTPTMKRRGPPRKEPAFDVKFFFSVLAMGLAIFVATVAIIRWWQRADLLDPWLKLHPKFNGQYERDRREAAKGSSSPWLGAEAGVLDARMLMERARRRAQVGPEHPADWLPNPHWPEKHVRPSSLKGKSEHEIRRIRVEQKESANEMKIVGSSPASEQPKQQWPPKQWPVILQDLVVAIPNHKVTEPQLMAGRLGRQGMRTFVATNYSEDAGHKYPTAQTESWEHYPDAEPARSFYPGDDRAALTPFLAYKSLGDSFKWMLYGDDDTVFFTDAALRLASTMDPELPYFVTDNLWWSPLFGGAWHPNPQAPRCLPCGYEKNVTAAVGMSMIASCPCTPDDICGLEGGYDNAFAGNACGAPRSSPRTYSMHGGAGALISIGLLRKVEWQSMERCVNHQWSSGGDAFLTQCLWEHGFAHTTPDPIWHPQKLSMFDPSPPGLNPDDFIIWKASHVLGNMLQQVAGVCTGLCKLEVENTVSLHLRARRTGGSEEGAAAFIRMFARLSTRIRGSQIDFSNDQPSDVTNGEHRALADKIDAEIETGIQLVKALTAKTKVSSEDQERREALVDSLRWSEGFGTVSARDATNFGMADTIANRVLEGILHKVKQYERKVPTEDHTLPSGLPGRAIDDLVVEVSKLAARS